MLIDPALVAIAVDEVDPQHVDARWTDLFTGQVQHVLLLILGTVVVSEWVIANVRERVIRAGFLTRPDRSGPIASSPRTARRRAPPE